MDSVVTSLITDKGRQLSYDRPLQRQRNNLAEHLLVYCIMLLTIISIHVLFVDQIWDGSIHLIQALQKDEQLWSIHWFETFHFLGQASTLLVFVCALFCFVSRQDALYYSVAFSVANLTVFITRMVYKAPRPFMTTL